MPCPLHFMLCQVAWDKPGILHVSYESYTSEEKKIVFKYARASAAQ